MTTLTRYISRGTDGDSNAADADTVNWQIGFSSTGNDAVEQGSTPRKAALTFRNVTLPQGQALTAATVYLYIDSLTSSPYVDVTIYGDDADDSSPVTSVSDGNGRTKTTASAFKNTGTSPAATVLNYWSVNVTSVVQEIIDRAGWSSGNKLTLLLEAPTTSFPTPYVFWRSGTADTTSDTEPYIVVTYGNDYSLPANTVSYAYTPSSVGVYRGFVALAVDTGAYAYTPAAIGVAVARVLTVDSLAYSYAPAAVGLTATHTALAVDAAAYAYTLAAVTFNTAKTLSIDTAAYEVMAAAIGLDADISLSVDTAAYTVTANDVGLQYNTDRRLMVDTQTYTVAFADVGLSQPWYSGWDAWAYTVTGADVGLAVSRVIGSGGGSFGTETSPIVITIGNRNEAILTALTWSCTNGDVRLRQSHRERFNQTNPRICTQTVAAGVAATAISFGDLVSPGPCLLKNVDSANAIQVGVQKDSAFVPLLRLEPSQEALLWVDSGTAFYAIAENATSGLLMVACDR